MNNDLISRSALLERLRTEREEIAITSQYNIGYTNGLTMAQSIALAASAVEPERPKGRWISVTERTPSEADGTVWVCLADVFPYNEKEPYIDAKHDRRITEAFYSQFGKRWYKDGAVFPDGVVTHWMEKPEPPKEDAE